MSQQQVRFKITKTKLQNAISLTIKNDSKSIDKDTSILFISELILGFRLEISRPPMIYHFFSRIKPNFGFGTLAHHMNAYKMLEQELPYVAKWIWLKGSMSFTVTPKS